MTKKVEKKVWDDKKIKWFKDTAEKWIKKYHLTEWVVIYRFNEKDKKDENSDSDRDLLADCLPDTVYKKASINFYPEILNNGKEKWSGNYVENVIKHELCHLLTAKISDLAEDRYTTEKQVREEIESLTQIISIIT